jgi:anti-sigma factor RsiW
MNCTECRESLVAYREDLLNAAQRQAVDRHLATCPSCRAEMNDLGAVHERLVADTEAVSRHSVEEHVMNRIIREQNIELKSAGPFLGFLRIGRTIMRKPTTKFAAAAVIVAAIVISLSQFNQPIVKAVEFSDITRAMQQASWLHMTTTGPSMWPADLWVGFESKILATKSTEQVSFASEKDHKLSVYDPNSNTIVSHYMESFPASMASPITVLTTIEKSLVERPGVQTTVRTGTYEGRKVQIQESKMTEQARSAVVTFYLDRDSKLLYSGEVKATDATGKVTAFTMSFEYPRSGPQSIYDMGVPHDARTGDKESASDPQHVLLQYERARAGATGEYIAVVTTHPGQRQDIVTDVDVDYTSAGKERWENHHVMDMDSRWSQVWPTYKQRLGNSFESLLAWTQQAHDDPHAGGSVFLFDGEYLCYNYWRIGRGFGKLNKVPQTDCVSDATASLRKLGWPMIYIQAADQIITDDYSRQNRLVCIECLRQGRVVPGGATPPGRRLYYLDPEQEYLCRRQVTEWCPDADWQRDKNYLKGVDPNRVAKGSIEITDIIETVQANGHWYPRTVVEKRTGDRVDYKDAPMTQTTRTVYFQISPAFPDGIFDLKKLPGQ